MKMEINKFGLNFPQFSHKSPSSLPPLPNKSSLTRIHRIYFTTNWIAFLFSLNFVMIFVLAPSSSSSYIRIFFPLPWLMCTIAKTLSRGWWLSWKFSLPSQHYHHHVLILHLNFFSSFSSSFNLIWFLNSICITFERKHEWCSCDTFFLQILRNIQIYLYNN